ncbi:methionyl-tRNA formyltransferase [Coprinopsis cinerea okayama7|uniref:methionyl-tRNA formyltransferase n=1 Tax=Coprinopsis cinerea (strain Okayama-7 / 130 / ATCC MYA-4618 / FGSC 9003) TaxID=240176 RepID=A8NBH9_COPC7|nr:methionyl-tRNA formyltransferase [Coprinopsis cinerea okayama7\|eukprot:XP_001832177.2 methionyl-tRNA formyltransferase [Coprinopsis cinerea okayama7\
MSLTRLLGFGRWRRAILSPSGSTAARRCFHSSRQHHNALESEKLKVLFMGRDEFSCLVLRELYAASDVWQELVVVTNQDQRVGRRASQVSVSPLKLLAQDLKNVWLEYIPDTKPEFRKWELPAPFSSYRYSSSEHENGINHEPPPPSQHVLVTASFGRILTRKHLSRFLPSRRLNVHPSLLPQYRGPAPIQHSIMNGDPETGVCVIEMLDAVKKDAVSPKAGIDAGDIWASMKMAQPATADFAQMRDALAVEGGKLLVGVLRKMKQGIEGTRRSQIQPDSQVALRPAPMIHLQDAFVDPAKMVAEQVCQKWRAIAHQRPIFTYRAEHHGEKDKAVQLHGLQLLPPGSSSHVEAALPQEPGSAICTSTEKGQPKRIFVRCEGGGIFALSSVKPAGKPVLPAADYWNGIKDKRKDGSIKFGSTL